MAYPEDVADAADAPLLNAHVRGAISCRNRLEIGPRRERIQLIESLPRRGATRLVTDGPIPCRGRAVSVSGSMVMATWQGSLFDEEMLDV